MIDTLSWKEAKSLYSESPFTKKNDKRLGEWTSLLSNLPEIKDTKICLSRGVSVELDWTEAQKEETKKMLLDLIPWRKGPFNIGGININSEWRSNLKWERFLALDISLEGKNILDVGSGNGYYAYRMKGVGASKITCLEPNLIHVVQFLAINHFIRSNNIEFIPHRLEELDPSSELFDVVFSMGVLYHQRDPISHLKLLSSNLRKGGIIILETIISSESPEVKIEKGRYANMPNVRYLYSIERIKEISDKAGLRVLKSTEGHITTTEEQRKTEWMPFKSFSDAISSDGSKTIEGYGLPKRSLFVLEAN